MKYLGVFVFVACFLILFAITSPGWSHSWYSWQCCSDNDCAEVIDQQEDGHGGIIVTSKHGTVLIPPDFERKPSQDEKFHVCMRQGTYRIVPICYYVPGGT